MRQIEAEKIITLSQELRRAKYPWEQKRISAKLDSIANSIQFEGNRISYDTGADSDSAWEIIEHHGDAPIVTPGQRIIEQPAHIIGMRMLGLSEEEIQRLQAEFDRDEFSDDIVAVVVNQQEQIQRLHPDKYPFQSCASDALCDGFAQLINAEKLWRSAEDAFIELGRADLALMYGYDSPHTALVVLLEHYALTRHDIKVLDRTAKEAHF